MLNFITEQDLTSIWKLRLALVDHKNKSEEMYIRANTCHSPTVLTPSLADNIGPMVDPQWLSLRTTTSCMGTPYLLATSRRIAAVIAVLA